MKIGIVGAGNIVVDFLTAADKIDDIVVKAICATSRSEEKLKKFCKAKKESFWLMGEVIHGDYSKWVNDEMLDSVTNYECYKGIYSSHNDKNYFEIAHSLNRQFSKGGIYKDIVTYKQGKKEYLLST